MTKTTETQTPTAEELIAITNHLADTGSRFELEDVLDDYAGYCRWEQKRFGQTSSFSDWLAASEWLDK